MPSRRVGPIVAGQLAGCGYAVPASASAAAAYNRFLARLFANPFWESEKVEFRRVLWSDARRAVAKDEEAFRSPGLYVWGGHFGPLHIGLAHISFKQRFSRYIWQTRSQCNLAATSGLCRSKRN